MIEEMLIELAKIGPVIAVLVIAIVYFLRREKKKEEEIEELHAELRQSEKENLTALYKMMSLIERIEERDVNKTDAIMKEIQEFRRSIEDKINALK